MLYTTATAVVGVWLVSVGFIGYFTRALNIMSRVLFATAGFLLFLPAGAVSYGIWTDIAGAGLVALLIARELLSSGQTSPAQPVD